VGVSRSWKEAFGRLCILITTVFGNPNFLEHGHQYHTLQILQLSPKRSRFSDIAKVGGFDYHNFDTYTIFFYNCQTPQSIFCNWLLLQYF
jgi:hypothetical protein